MRSELYFFRQFFCLLTTALSLFCIGAHAQSIQTIAGGGSGAGQPATQVGFGSPTGLVVDALGNVYFSDSTLMRVFKIDNSGSLNLVAGDGGLGFGGDGGPASNASIDTPFGIALDPLGNLLVADYYNLRVRRVDVSGTIGTVAGRGPQFPSGISAGPATEVDISPEHVAVDASNNIYILSAGSISKVNSAGILSPLPTSFSGDASDIALDSAGGLYIADRQSHQVLKRNADGSTLVIAGNGVQGYQGDGGPAIGASLAQPKGIAIDASGNLYISEAGNHVVRKVDTSGIITTVAGTGVAGNGGDGGAATQTNLSGPAGIAIDMQGNLYIAESGRGRIRKVNANGIISTIAGDGTGVYLGNGGLATLAGLRGTYSALDNAGNLYIADRSRIRKVTSAGFISTIAGTGEFGFSGDGGPASTAQIFAIGIARDASGNIYFADMNSHRVRKIDIDGIITTVAGNGVAGAAGDGGPAAMANLDRPYIVSVDLLGNIYIVEFYKHRVRKVDASGFITTLVGTGVAGFSGDGGPASLAQVSFPYGIAFDSANNVYVSDSQNGRIRRISVAGVITTVAGIGPSASTGDDGPATAAGLRTPSGIAFDASGNLYVAEEGSHTIRKISNTGIISTVAGVKQSFRAYNTFSGDGGPALDANLNGPSAIFTDFVGNLYISDAANFRVRKVSFGPDPLSLVVPNDFNDDAKSDLLWRNGADGSVQGWLMNGLSATQVAGLLPAGGYTISHVADLDGNGKADTLIRHADGTTIGWLHDGLNVVGQATFFAPGSGWSIKHTLDLNGDGKADLIVEHTDGRVVGWLMNGLTVTGTATFVPAGTGWSVSKVGDLNGDGKADLIWQNANGTVQAWLMDGLSTTQTATFVGSGTGWSVKLVGDFNGDNKADLVWQNTDGTVQAWLMDGTAISQIASFVPAGTGWSPVLAGDIDGDGKADLFWEHTDGRSQTWLMNGLSVTNLAGFVGAGGWKATHLLDLNGDGKKDVLWKHTDGMVQGWLLNGLTITQIASLAAAGSYEVVPPRQ